MLIFMDKITSRRDRLAWYLYDFGNSAYAAVVVLAVYSAYFKDGVVGGEQGTLLWGRSVAIAMIVVAIISPVLGALADFSGLKKRLLLIFTLLSGLFTAMLYFVHTGDIWQGMLFFILAEIGYRGAQVFYNGFLPEIAEPDEMGRVSGIGWAVGSTGGIVCLLIVLPLIVANEGNQFYVRLSFIITAAFFLIATLPLFIWLKEKSQPTPLPAGESYLTMGFRQLGRTLRQARNHREFLKFLLAFIVFHDGVMMVYSFAAIIGGTLFGMDQTQLIILIILVQITNVVGAIVFGYMADRRGTKRALLISLVLLAICIIVLYPLQGVTPFIILASAAGFAMAGVQSLSRAFIGQLCPPEQSAEFYGLFAVAGRSSSFIGPWVFGLVAFEATQRAEANGLLDLAAEQQGLRVAILSILAFLIVGGALLLWVKERSADGVS